MNSHLVVIGASAGGIEALTEIVRALPGDFPAPIAIVVHMSPQSSNSLVEILKRRTVLKVKAAGDRAPIVPGEITVAVPNHHLMVQDGRYRVVAGPRHNRNRPSIDTLFRSAALSYGPAVVAVVLSGLLDDGSVGLIEIKRYGGVGVVQEPADALFDSMPRNAIDADHPDFVLPLAEIPGKLAEIVRQPVPKNGNNGRKRPKSAPVSIARKDESVEEHERKDGTPAVYTCPECSGTMWEKKEGDTVRYECRVGHTFSQLGMEEAKRDALEQAMWVALRTLEESASLSKRMADRARERNHVMVARRWEELAKTRSKDAGLLREILFRDTEAAVNE